MLICHKIRSLQAEQRGARQNKPSLRADRSKTRCHCERTAGERGNLMNGTRKGQIASAKTPRNDGREKQIASLRSQ